MPVLPAAAAALTATRGRVRLLIMSRAASPAATVGSPSTMSIKQLKGKAAEWNREGEKKERKFNFYSSYLNVNIRV